MKNRFKNSQVKNFLRYFFQLEEVMEKETYKKAKDILEKFDPERFKKLEVSSYWLFYKAFLIS